ncbi:MAG: hypothetical protein FJX29_00165, partial [Alphaproteobacteria bacterium]|nr:hypothetical protein [Alphaproteobacteria bacterium]
MLAASAVTLNRRSFIDAKILHFAYFYLLWLLIALAVRAALKPGESFAELPLDYVKALVEPFGMLWFIHILPAMYLILRLSAARWLWPAVAVSMALHFWASLNLTGNGGAMGAHMTGSTFADSMALYLVYFMLGYALRHHIHNWAGFAARKPRFAILALAAWFIMHATAMTAGIAQKPFVTLFFGLAGAMAIVTIAVLIAQTFAGSFATLFGRNSLAIYLAFGIPMVIAREALQRSGFDIDPGLRALAITSFALVAPFAMRIIARQAGFGFMF